MRKNSKKNRKYSEKMRKSKWDIKKSTHGVALQITGGSINEKSAISNVC